MAAARSGWLWRGMVASVAVVLLLLLIFWWRSSSRGQSSGADTAVMTAADSSPSTDRSERSGPDSAALATSAPMSTAPVDSAPVGSTPPLAAVPAESPAGRPAAAAGGTERIRVRVLNTTGVHGLARRMTFLLRDAGFDVVDFDSDAKQAAPETRILMHSAHPEWAARLRQAIGVGTAVSRPDSLRGLDLTVLIGRDWRAPAQPLRP